MSGESAGGEGFTIIAAVKMDDGALSITVANHDGPTCADPLAYPDLDFEHCELTETLFVAELTLDPPLTVPGVYDGAIADSQLHIFISERSPSAPELPCDGGFGGNPHATLTLDELSADQVSGTIDMDGYGLDALPFDVPLCP